MGKVSQLVFLLTGLVGLLLAIKTAFSLAYYLSYQWFNWGDLNSYNFSRDQLSCDRPFFYPLFWNISLLLLFIFQHSAMTTTGWKNLVSLCGCAPLERSIYTIVTCVTLEILMQYYDTSLAFALWGFDLASIFLLGRIVSFVHAALWLVIFLSTLGMEFMEFVGLLQVFEHCFPPTGVRVQMEGMRKGARDRMRHSGVVCFVVILWLQPAMSADRFLLSLVFTLYALFGHRVTNSDYIYIKAN